MRNPNLRSKMKSKRLRVAKIRKNPDYKIQKINLLTEMDIAQNLAVRIGPKLEEMNPRSLPEVFKQPRGLNNSQKREKKRKNLSYKI